MATASARASMVGSHSTMRPPSAFVAATLVAGAPRGITIVHAMPRVDAARASADAWLPELWATTPRAASSSDSCSTALVAPRSLKAPVAWRCSALRCTRVPAQASMAADRSTGVGGTSAAMRAAAARTSSNDGPGLIPTWRSWWSGR